MVPLHILSFGFVLGVSAIADKDALSWLRGTKTTLDHTTLRTYHLMIWAGLASLVITGFILFYPQRAFLLGNLLFDIKMLFVMILALNALLIGRLMDHAMERPYAALGTSEKQALFVSGAISVFSWFSAAAIALYIFG
jgi:hypothetical protein